MEKHIPFRAKVKADGHATFTHNEKSYKFKIAPAAAAE
jgi:hypothetical protein